MIRKNAGYTLIESAIVLMIVGLLMASFMGAYKVYLASRAQAQTAERVSKLTETIGNYLIRNGRYPCPAAPALDRADALYGVESQCDPTSAAYPLSSNPGARAVGTCDLQGLCYEVGETFTDISSDPNNACDRTTGPLVAGACEKVRVRRGAVPFRTLGISEEQAEDGLRNRIMYVVTEPLAVTATYQKRGGAISIVNANGVAATNSAIQPPSSAHFFVFSPGPDKKGAYTRYGKLVEPCATSGALDAENCNTASTGTNMNAIYRYADYSAAVGTNIAFHFDDFVKFFSSVQTPLWQVTGTGFDIKDLIDAEAAPGTANVVGIAKTPDVAPALFNNDENFIPVVQVNGNILVDGNTVASEICDGAHRNCFKLENITTDGTTHVDEEHFQCPTGYATGVGDAEIKCTPAAQQRCGTGQIMKGVTPGGDLVCENVVGCPAIDVPLCTISGTTDTRTINGGTQNQVWTASPVSGSSYTETWRCGPGASGSGQWTRQSTSGYCVCNAADTTSSVTCNSRRSGNWTGNYTTRTVTTCPANTTSTTETNNCVCAPRTESRSASCPTNLTGAVTQTRDWICDSPTAGHWTAWTNASSTCTCVPTTQQDHPSCPTGYSGSTTRERTLQCPAATWTAWTETANTCTCTATSQSRTQGCPSPLTGTIYQSRDFTCPAGTWSAWYETSNTCVCTPQSQTADTGCGAYYSGRIYTKRDLTCPSGVWGSWYETSRTCACSGGTRTQTVACGAPLVGSKTQTMAVNCVAGVPTDSGVWTDSDTSGCSIVTYNWHAKTAPSGPFGSSLPKSAGGACSTFGENSPCSSATGGGQYYHYSVCQCE